MESWDSLIGLHPINIVLWQGGQDLTWSGDNGFSKSVGSCSALLCCGKETDGLNGVSYLTAHLKWTTKQKKKVQPLAATGQFLQQLKPDSSVTEQAKHSYTPTHYFHF